MWARRLPAGTRNQLSNSDPGYRSSSCRNCLVFLPPETEGYPSTANAGQRLRINGEVIEMNLFADGSEWFPLHGLSFNWFGFGSPLCLALFISLSFYNKLSFFRPASPPSMETHEIRQRKCRLCCPFSQEAKIIAKTVYRKIQRSAKGQNRWGNNFEEGLLAGLEKQVAPLGTTKHKPDGPCTHLPLQMYQN